MKKSIVSVVAASLMLGACGSGGSGEVAATVGDSEISVADVRAFPLEDDGALEPQEFAQYLGALIQWKILDDAANSEFGIDPTDEELDAEIEAVLEQQGNEMSLAEVGEAQNLSEETMRQIVRVGLLQEKVGEELGTDAEEPGEVEIAEAMDQQVMGQTEVCVRHVLVGSADEADEVRQRLEDGEDFAAVAGEMSTDPSAAENGGDLGCAPAQTYVPEFQEAAVTAEIDEITEPVESQFGFHVLQVYERNEPAEGDLPTDEEIRDMITGEAEMAELQAWLTEKLDEAEVSVDEEYGTWTLEPQPGVQPPAA